MEELKSMKKALINCVQSQINGNLKEVDAEELGEAVDMIKDLEEAIYYATITKAMEDGDTILLEPEREVSYQIVDERDKADFNRMEVKNILPELSLFLRSFFDNVQLPNFAKNTLKR